MPATHTQEWLFTPFNSREMRISAGFCLDVGSKDSEGQKWVSKPLIPWNNHVECREKIRGCERWNLILC